MYTSIPSLRRFGESHINDPRPLILCEFSHAMGNSNGCFAEYWDAIRETPGIQGGFIWDWQEQGLYQQNEQGAGFWAFGGDFGEVRHDTNFCCNGLINPDLSPKPALVEIAHCFAPIEVEAIDLSRGSISVHNNYNFADLSHLQGRWVVTVDGEIVQSGLLPSLDTFPGIAQTLELPYRLPRGKDGQEATLDISWEIREKTIWCASGHRIQQQQFRLPLIVSDDSPKLEQVAITASTWREADDCEMCLNANGIQISQAGTSLLLDGPKLNLYRAPTDNDGIKDWSGQEDKPLGRWHALGPEPPAKRGNDLGMWLQLRFHAKRFRNNRLHSHSSSKR